VGRLRWLAAHLEEGAAAALVILLSLLAFANVVTRYVVSYSLAFSEELEVAGLVWLTMLGGAVAVRRSAHIGFTFVRDRFGRPTRRAMAAAAAGLTVGSALVLVWYGWQQIRAERALSTVSEALGWPQWIYTAAIPVGGLLVAIRAVLAARRAIADA
jgi:C4-dicarboxylate transporter, DctQ subunit